jgi:hypothetical protein
MDGTGDVRISVVGPVPEDARYVCNSGRIALAQRPVVSIVDPIILVVESIRREVYQATSRLKISLIFGPVHSEAGVVQRS